MRGWLLFTPIGLAVVGDLIGEGSAQEQSVVGETPNLAARLQALAEPDTVVIAAGTRRLVGDLFECQDLGAVVLKGIAAPVLAWQVLRPSVVASRFEALRGSALTPLVGRDEEIELLLRRWTRAKAGDGQVVLIPGEPGIGKSRLAAALQQRLRDEAHTRLRYFCSPFTRTARSIRSSIRSAGQPGLLATIHPLLGWRSLKRCWPRRRRRTRMSHSSPICCHCRRPSAIRCGISARSGRRKEHWRH